MAARSNVPTRRKVLENLAVAGSVLAAGSGIALAARRSRRASDETSGNNEPSAAPSRRSVARHVVGDHETVGAGFQVRRTMPHAELSDVDPFILLDLFDNQVQPDMSPGLPPHPHRGFETVTVMLEGAAGHRDSLGNRGVVGAGGVQWMTTGAGIIHADHADHDFARQGGRILGVQLWVNLPARRKLMEPGVQEEPIDVVPVHEAEGVVARILAGSAHELTAPVTTQTPLLLVDYALAPGAAATLPLPRSWNAFAQVCDGELAVGGRDRTLSAGELITFAHDGEELRIAAPENETARVLVGAGEPIGEPIARWGPFVMNTRAELRRAQEDYRAGLMGWLEA